MRVTSRDLAFRALDERQPSEGQFGAPHEQEQERGPWTTRQPQSDRRQDGRNRVEAAIDVTADEKLLGRLAAEFQRGGSRGCAVRGFEVGVGRLGCASRVRQRRRQQRRQARAFGRVRRAELQRIPINAAARSKANAAADCAAAAAA